MTVITAAQIVQGAQKYAGIKYFEGNPQNTTNGFDCSGLVQQVMKDLGMSIPRTTSQQLAAAGSHNIGTDLTKAGAGDILHYVGHEEIWLNSNNQVFSEATPGTVAGVRGRTPWPIIGIVRYWDWPGQSVTVDPNTGGITTEPFPGANSITGFISAFTGFIGDVTNGGFWQRVGLAFLGAVLLILGIYLYTHKGQVITVSNATSTAAKAVSNASSS